MTTYGDEGSVRYIFPPDTKLKINGKFVNYTRYEGDESDGFDGTKWVLTDLTMTPEARDKETLNPTWKTNSSNSSSTATPSKNKPNTGEKTNLKTGDTSPMFLWITMLVLSCGAIIGTAVAGRKKKYKK